MSGNLLITGGRVVDPDGDVDEKRDVLIREGRLADPEQVPDDCERIDASGAVVIPGMIDLHTHLREPGLEHKESIASGTKAAVRGGFTAVCAMANTMPPNDERAVTEMIAAEASRNGSCRVYPIGAVSKGLEGEALSEMADLKLAGCVAFSDDGHPVSNSLLMRRALEYSRMLDMPISVHEEDLDLAEGGVMHEGYYSTLLGLKGHPAVAEESMAWRDVLLAQLTGGRLHIAHVSTRGAIEAVRHGRKEGARVTCEVTPHHIAISDAELVSYSTKLKMKPPLRSEDHIAAVIEGIVDGTVDAIATDHAPHHADEKEVEYDLAPFGIIGLESAFAVACEVLLHGGHIGLGRLVELFTIGPARAFSLDGGTLNPGGLGDVTIVDPDAEVELGDWWSRAENSPWTGMKMRGRVLATIVAGEVRYIDASLSADRA